MEIDATTLSELEVFRSPDGSEGLFQLIDRTVTGLGRRHLRQLLERPISDPAELRRAQDAVRFFMERPLAPGIDDRSVAATSRYLQSNIEAQATAGLGGHVEYWWMKLKYRDILKEVAEGVELTTALFEQLATLGLALTRQSPPELVSRQLALIKAGTDCVLRNARPSPVNPLRADKSFRVTDRDTVWQGLQAFATLDALNAMACATASFGWTIPEVLDADTFHLSASDVTHPFLRDPVPNPVRISDSEPVLFLTGPNMAGKTTYLRSVALLVYLAHVGMGVPATRASITPVDLLLTSLNPADNLKAGLSYFLAEVQRVRTAVTAVADGKRVLVLFDEVFKGTNIRDAAETSATVIRGLARARGSGFVFSSHLIELVDALKSSAGIRFCCFDAEIVHGTAQYTYRLRDGVSDKRFGLFLLEQAGIGQLLAKVGKPVQRLGD